MNIFVGSLPFKIEEAKLKGFFEAYGEVASVRIITDKFSGRSRGFGFIEMPDSEHAKKAIEELNGAEVEGRTIVVNEAEEKKTDNRKSNFRGGNDKGGYNRDKGGYNKGGYRGGNSRDGGRSNY